MVAARTAVLADDGPFCRLRTAIAQIVGATTPEVEREPLLLDVGSGTGQYSATCLDRLPTAFAVGIDLSKACARSTARAHPRLAGVVADAWSRLPLVDDSVDTVLSVFSPRNVEDFARVLRPDGRLVVAAPETAHLRELIEPMGMLRVGEDKYDALLAATSESFAEVSTEVIGYTVDLPASSVVDLVAMGPSAFHSPVDEIVSRATDFVGARSAPVTVAVRVTVLRRR